MRLFILFISTLAVLATHGCTPVQQVKIITVPGAEPVITEEEKLKIYQSVKIEIDNYIGFGEGHYNKGEYYKALVNYKRAYSLDNTLVEVEKKIELLEKKIVEEATRHFEEGQKQLPDDRIKALASFNSSLRVNPDFSAALIAWSDLMHEPEISTMTADLEAELVNTLDMYTSSLEDIALLNKNADAVMKYDYQNKIALNAKKIAERDRQEIISTSLKEGYNLLEEGDLDKAKLSFQMALALEEYSEEAKEALRSIQHRKDINYLLNLAQTSLKKKDYQKAVEYSGKTLKLDSYNKEAEKILTSALEIGLKPTKSAQLYDVEKKNYISTLYDVQKMLARRKNGKKKKAILAVVSENLKAEVDLLLAAGQNLYDEKQLKKALSVFEYVLELDPANDLSKTFIKKIHNRLETIESLQ